MRWYFLAFLFLLTLSGSAFAQNENLDIVSEPLCFTLRNEAAFEVFGYFATDHYTREDGIKTKHRSNFRLKEAGAKNAEDQPTDTAEFCSYGPFIPERKLELILRTLVPIFSCKTRIDQGEIVIKGHRKPEGGTELWAECYL